MNQLQAIEEKVNLIYELLQKLPGQVGLGVEGSGKKIKPRKTTKDDIRRALTIQWNKSNPHFPAK